MPLCAPCQNLVWAIVKAIEEAEDAAHESHAYDVTEAFEAWGI
jgi:hypothetical protein